MTKDNLEKSKLGILGGSGFYNIENLTDIRELEIETPYGKPSDILKIGRIGNLEVVFLARHGRHHTFTPSEVPYRANIWAMRSLDVRWIVSASAVGSLKSEIRPLDIVIPDQFLDKTHNRPVSFFGEGAVAHVSMADPFCNDLRRILFEASKPLLSGDRKIHYGGTYLCMEGPAFSTKAESKFYKSIDCSIIGMTNHTEARLCKEAEIAYGSLSMSTDYDCWHEDHENVSVEMIIKNLNSNTELAKKIVIEVANIINQKRPISSSHDALRNALISNKDYIPKKTIAKLSLFTDKYWSN